MVVLVLCVAAVTAVSMHVRCIDAAREAARLAARGDDPSSARRLAPAGAVLQLRRDGDFVVARISADPPLLPGVTIGAEAMSLAEPAGG